MFLMNKDNPVLWFKQSKDNPENIISINILNNDLLPYCLKDYVTDTNNCTTEVAINYITLLRDFLANRVLTISRDNAKVILNCAQLPQKLSYNQKIQIAMFCRGLSMSDNYWLKNDDENILFKEVNLRNISLGESVFDISMLGNHLSIQRELLIPDIATQGMFRKTWERREDGTYLLKSDKTFNFINSKSEVSVSNQLKDSNINYLLYIYEERQGIGMSVCKNMTNDDISLVDADDIRMWCAHTNQDFMTFIKANFKSDFYKMCVVDYVFANLDRHINNWGVLVDNKNEILGFAPLYDFNQALISDYKDVDIDDFIYEPTNKSMLESAKKAILKVNIKIPNLEGKAIDRLNVLLKYKREKEKDFLSY